MTYHERQRYKELREELDQLRQRIEAGDPEEPLTRAEGRALLSLVEEAIARMSPDRWDRALDAVVEEAARRARSGSGFGS